MRRSTIERYFAAYRHALRDVAQFAPTFAPTSLTHHLDLQQGGMLSSSPTIAACT